MARTAAPRALVFAPPPPSAGGMPGGIAAITAVLMRELGHRSDVAFGSPVRKEEGGRFGLRRGLSSLVRLARATRGIARGGTVLFFASSGLSFWEKLAWGAVTRAMGRRVAMVMVDGHFPGYWARLPGAARAAARATVRALGIRVGAQSATWRDFYRGILPGVVVEPIAASVDREFFDAVRVPGEAGAPVRLLFVGWIVEAKGVLDLLDAVRLVADAGGARFALRLVGPVLDDPARWAGEIERRGVGAFVTLAGSVNDRAALLREYQRADAFIFPSHFEGFPVALMEAAAVGLPCVGTRVGGIPDILREGEAGLLVPPRDPEALATAIRALLGDPGQRATLGETLQRHARAEYTPARCAASYLSLLGLD